MIFLSTRPRVVIIKKQAVITGMPVVNIVIIADGKQQTLLLAAKYTRASSNDPQ